MSTGEITSYKCPCCGAPLRYDANTGKVVCDSCGNTYETDAAEAMEKAAKQDTGFDWGDYKKTLSKDKLEDTRVYCCTSCGAELVVDSTTAATHCPYCDSEVIVNDRLSGGIRPNGIIPFKIDKKQLPDLVNQFYKNKYFLPRGFFDSNKIEKAQGVYVPFWLYDCHVEGEMLLNATRISVWSDQKYNYTKTSHYLLSREGEMTFSNIPVDASSKMDNDLMDSVEPFDLRGLQEFGNSYLSGYLAERFDEDPDHCLDRVTLRTRNSAADLMKDTARGYNTVTQSKNHMRISDTSVRYVLLPVYLFHCTYGGKRYRYAVNGQTGKVAGEVPFCIEKVIFAYALSFLAALAVVMPCVLWLFG